MQKQIVRISNNAFKVINKLSNTDILEYLPNVTGIRGERVEITFSRLLFFKFRDLYRVDKSIDSDGALRITLAGERSKIIVELFPKNSHVEYTVHYIGPKKWIVYNTLKELPINLIKWAEKQLVINGLEGRQVGSYDYSILLSRLSFVSKLIMRSVLIKDEVRVLKKGDLPDYITFLFSENSTVRRYPAIYVSGDAYNVKFRLLFIEGELAGVYIVVDNREHYGDESLLNTVKGLTRIRVYGIMDIKLVKEAEKNEN